MGRNLTEQSITAAVQQTFDTSTDDRIRVLFVSLVQHLHDFAREVRLTGDEWFIAMSFLEQLGKVSSPTRQEVVLASDILGLSMLLDIINQQSSTSATDSALLGPFYVEGRPKAWHSDGSGFYDVQQTDELHGELAMRALLTADHDDRRGALRDTGRGLHPRCRHRPISDKREPDKCHGSHSPVLKSSPTRSASSWRAVANSTCSDYLPTLRRYLSDGLRWSTRYSTAQLSPGGCGN